MVSKRALQKPEEIKFLFRAGRERPAAALGPERGRAPRPGAAGGEGRAQDADRSPPPSARPAAPASWEASDGDILAELRTMNGHLGVIARALNSLASALGPPPQPAPGAPAAGR